MQVGSSAIVLAGGQSRRMGQDKALLAVEGCTFLEHIVRVVRSLTEDIILVTDREDRYSFPDLRVVADIYAESGPVAGIVTGLLYAGTGAHWVVPCDMPTISRSILETLHNACDASWDAVVPEIGGEPEPLVAVYRDTALPKLQRYLAEGRRSARGALACLRVKRIDEAALRRVDPELDSFLNVNTPLELAHFLQIRQRSS